MRILYGNQKNEINQLLQKRLQFNDHHVEEVVKKIIDDVKLNKDQALIKYSKLFEGIDLSSFKVTEQEILDAYQIIDPILQSDLKLAMENITYYHEKQKLESIDVYHSDDIKIKQRIKPIENVGIYVPGGTASYPSTVLMNAIPAKIAGVKRIIMVTPPRKDGTIKPSILVAARMTGVDEIYKVGGAQAVAALTYGTQSIPKVDMIVGPGNIYVSTAKKLLIGQVGIDMIAGPTEIVILADHDANPSYISADLLAQAEHDERSSSILITDSIDLAHQVNIEIEKQMKILSREAIIDKAIKNYGAILIVNTLDEGIQFINEIAPEHLEIMTKNAFEIVDFIENAGSIFLGNYTPEPVGDYYAGPNHTLPTSSTSRFSSPLSTSMFYKKTSILYYDKNALSKAKNSIMRLAHEEGLDGHAEAINIRFKEDHRD